MGFARDRRASKEDARMGHRLQVRRLPPDGVVMTAPSTAKPKAPRLLVCNCQRTMVIDGRSLSEGLGAAGEIVVHHELCRAQIGQFEAALGSGGAVHVACTQEAPLFREVAEEKGATCELTFTNIRE